MVLLLLLLLMVFPVLATANVSHVMLLLPLPLFLVLLLLVLLHSCGLQACYAVADDPVVAAAAMLMHAVAAAWSHCCLSMSLQHAILACCCCQVLLKLLLAAAVICHCALPPIVTMAGSCCMVHQPTFVACTRCILQPPHVSVMQHGIMHAAAAVLDAAACCYSRCTAFCFRYKVLHLLLMIAMAHGCIRTMLQLQEVAAGWHHTVLEAECCYVQLDSGVATDHNCCCYMASPIHITSSDSDSVAVNTQCFQHIHVWLSALLLHATVAYIAAAACPLVCLHAETAARYCYGFCTLFLLCSAPAAFACMLLPTRGYATSNTSMGLH